MAAPKGNQFGRFKHAGNPRSFPTPEDLWKAFEDYKQWVNDNPWMKNEAVKSGVNAGTVMQVPTQRPLLWEGFADHANIDRSTLKNYRSNEEPYKEYFDVSTRIANAIERDNLEGGYVGAYDGGLVARKLGIADKQAIKAEVENTSSIISVNVGKETLDLSLRPKMERESDK